MVVTSDTDKIMFEIFGLAGESRGFRVVYFTELDERERDKGIDQALAGDHVYDGFIAERHATEAKAAIDSLLGRLNQGEPMDRQQVETILAPHVVV